MLDAACSEGRSGSFFVKYEVRKYKELKTYSGLAFTFTLYVDGKPACDVEERGDGSEMRSDWRASGATSTWSTDGSAAAARVTAFVATIPVETFNAQLPESLRMDPSEPVDVHTWFGFIADELVQDRKLKRLCRSKKTVFRKSDTPAGDWIVSTRPYSAEFAKKLRAEDPKVEIYNERAL